MQRAEAMEQARLASNAFDIGHFDSLTPPLTPDMSTLPGAWPRFPEPLPFTTIGTAAITPPESRLLE